MNKYLVIGLGSMGKRRIRCLMALGISASNILGTDIREDRCKESQDKYGINIVENIDNLDFTDIKAVIVSLPPDLHYEGVKIAEKHKKPVFVEASVILDDVEKIDVLTKGKIFVAPSCTFLLHPLIKVIKEIVASNKYGKVCNYSYHSGQYLPDWHPWESVNDFYVSKRETGGAREIVPYELTWMNNVFGEPVAAKGYFKKTRELGCDIEDSYVASLDYGDFVGTLLVDVVARNATRNLIINFEEAQIQWRCDKEYLEIFEAKSGQWKFIEQGETIHEEGYAKNINENMYIEEIELFLKGIEHPEMYPNSLEKDKNVLKILLNIENN